MATKTITRYSALVLHLSIPVSRSRTAVPAAAAAGRHQSLGSQESSSSSAGDQRWQGANRCNLQLERRSHSQSSQRPSPNSSGHNSTDGRASLTADTFEGDRISLTKFRWMARIPKAARKRLLLAIEPPRMTPRSPSGGDGGGGSDGEFVVADFCIPFSFELLRKMRAGKTALRQIASMTFCVIHVKKTLLLRGTWRTKTWTKFFMFRFYCLKQTFLDRCLRLLEKFDAAFCSRRDYKAAEPRVTLVLNRTVPENTALRLTRQRIRSSDIYFGKMPLLPDPHLENLAASLTTNCLNEASLLAQMVMMEP